MKIFISTVCFLMVSVTFASVSHSFIPAEKMQSIISKCKGDVSGMEKAFEMEAKKIPIPEICETLKKEDLISTKKCISFFEQKKEAEAVVDFKNSKEAYTVLYDVCVAMETDNQK